VLSVQRWLLNAAGQHRNNTSSLIFCQKFLLHKKQQCLGAGVLLKCGQNGVRCALSQRVQPAVAPQQSVCCWWLCQLWVCAGGCASYGVERGVEHSRVDKTATGGLCMFAWMCKWGCAGCLGRRGFRQLGAILGLLQACSCLTSCSKVHAKKGLLVKKVCRASWAPHDGLCADPSSTVKEVACRVA
jgi:hypothetical protein